MKLRICRPFKHVYQVDPYDGHIINEFISCEDVHRQFNTPETNICRCCNDKKGYSTVVGYIWIYVNDYEEKINNYKWRKSHGLISIKQYDLDMNLIRIWPSLKQIEKELGYKSNTLTSALNGSFKTLKGYIWRYVDEDILQEEAC